MRIRLKHIIAALFLLLWVAWELFLQPIWNLNVERLAEEESIDTALKDALPSVWGWQVSTDMIQAVSYLTGPFLTGFVIAATIFGFWDLAARFLSSGEKSQDAPFSDTTLSDLEGAIKDIHAHLGWPGSESYVSSAISIIRMNLSKFTDEPNTTQLLRVVQAISEHINNRDGGLSLDDMHNLRNTVLDNCDI